MMKVAITGNVGSGKSTLARIWIREGVPVLSADEVAREVVKPGTSGLGAVVADFGPEILNPDGTLDRAALRRTVFKNSARRKKLEDILHPRIAAARDEWMDLQARKGQPLAVAEIPLLYELGLEEEFHVVVLVHAPYAQRLTRLMENRDMEEEEARRIMAAQMPAQEKLGRATFVVHNDGSLPGLETLALDVLDLLREQARKGGRP